MWSKGYGRTAKQLDVDRRVVDEWSRGVPPGPTVKPLDGGGRVVDECSTLFGVYGGRGHCVDEDLIAVEAGSVPPEPVPQQLPSRSPA